MAILHTVNKSRADSHCLDDCLACCAPGDAVLLIEDGVYNAAMATGTGVADTVQLYALQADLETRGLLTRVDKRVGVIDDSMFVRLACEYDKVVSWY